MIKVAIIGTGNIGTDLLIKLSRVEFVKLVAFVGRRIKPTYGIDVLCSDQGIEFFKENPKCCDVVFDCTDAFSAIEHSKIFQDQNITVIDMTPSKIGVLCVPHVSSSPKTHKNINMITCGGQVAIPLLKYFSTRCHIRYAEVVTQISSDSAGPATRINIDKYIETTEHAIKTLVDISNCKVILNINPHHATIMQTTIFIETEDEGNFADFANFVNLMKIYVPKYEIACSPKYIKPSILMTSVKINGSGDFLSVYAGNLDIINCAAIEVLKTIVHDAQPNIYNMVLDI